MRWLVVLMVGMLLVACGGDSDSPTTATPSGASETSTPAPQATPSAKATTSGASLRLDGAELKEMDSVGTCGDGVLGDARQYIATTVGEGDSFWMFQLYIHKFDGPGTYDVGDPGSAYDASISLGDGSGTVWHSSREAGGTVTVNSDGDSGTIDATIAAPDNGTEIHVTGTWVCGAI